MPLRFPSIKMSPSPWDQLNMDVQDELGEPITYVNEQGHGDPVEIACTVKRPEINQQAAAVGYGAYFADIEVQPSDVPAPQKKDQVIWQDGTVYLVGLVRQLSPYLPFTLALHRQSDR